MVGLLVSRLRSNCRAQGREQDAILMTLKALGNMGVAPQAAGILTSCAAETENSMEVRLAALDSLKQQSCEAEVGENLPNHEIRSNFSY